MSVCSIYDPLFWDVTDLSAIIIHKDSKNDDCINDDCINDLSAELRELVDSWRSTKVPAFISRYNTNNLFYNFYRHEKNNIIYNFDFIALSLELHVKLGYCTTSILNDHLQDLHELYKQFENIIEQSKIRHSNWMYIFKYVD